MTVTGWATLGILDNQREERVEFKISGTSIRLWGPTLFLGDAFVAKGVRLVFDDKQVMNGVIQSHLPDGMATFVQR
ncbi:MAG TPA: hypothetical protein VMF90_00890 [Rhizobiaceae bacterium]|nr:hypothetical protein [Rhizobiaceae bacterium]